MDDRSLSKIAAIDLPASEPRLEIPAPSRFAPLSPDASFVTALDEGGSQTIVSTASGSVIYTASPGWSINAIAADGSLAMLTQHPNRPSAPGRDQFRDDVVRVGRGSRSPDPRR